jgi:hypothetical protein
MSWSMAMRSGPPISSVPLIGSLAATRATTAETSAAAIGCMSPVLRRAVPSTVAASAMRPTNS